MVNRTYETMQACLLCDFGGILHRAEIGSGRPEQRAADYFSDKLPRSVTEAIRYHRTTLPEEGMDPNSLAHIVRAARDIALGFEAQPDPASDAMPLEVSGSTGQAPTFSIPLMEFKMIATPIVRRLICGKRPFLCACSIPCTVTHCLNR